MRRSIFQPEWRTQSKRKRRFYARYMGWLERTGFVIVTLLLAGFVYSFFYEVEEWVSAEDVPIELVDTPEQALVLKPKLGGKSIAKAAIGQDAKITNIRIAAEGDTLLRANVQGSGVAVSRRLAGDAVKTALESSLKGRTVQSREDIPLTISEIGDIEVEADLKTTASQERGLTFDPSIGVTLIGRVTEGKHVLSAQLGDLPPDVRNAAVRALKEKLQGQTVEVDGKPQKIEEILDPRFVVRLTAENAAAGGNTIQAASLKRTFDATIVLDQVPLDLQQRIRDAIRQGKVVTAKVQVRTGKRPIAYFLLRRS